MVDNPTKVYNDYVRANLPVSMSYDTNTDRYDINNHSFFKFKNSNWYFNYISKYGYSALTDYAVNGLDPALVFDFIGNYFRKDSTDTTTTGALNHNSATAGNATMVDSTGNIKWRPHNLLSYSEDFTNAYWIADGVTKAASTLTEDTSTGNHYIYGAASTSGAVTLAVTVSNVTNNIVWLYINTSVTALAYFNVSTGSVGTIVGAGVTASITDLGSGKFLCELRRPNGGAVNVGFGLTDGTETISHTGDGSSSAVFENAHLYRSDLGGMVNNPDRGDSYVPTTSAARYLPRRGHHVYNGSAWVNEGLLHESDARTNLVPVSNDFAGVVWPKTGVTVSDNADASPSGIVDADRLVENTASGGHFIYDGVNTTGTNTFSVFAKRGTQDFVALTFQAGTGNHATQVFDLTDGTVGEADVGATSGLVDNATVEDFGGGWYRCSATITLNGSFCVISLASAKTGNSFDSNGRPTYLGASKYISVYGAQIETASTPSSYIPTAGATVTRAAETLTIPAANLPWPTPVVIGDELVTNGTFDSGSTGYTEVLNGTVSYAANTMFATGTTGNTGVYQDVACGVGVFEVTWTQVSGTQLRINIYDGASFSTSRYNNGTGNSDTGSFNQSVVSTTGVLRLYLHTSAGNTAEFDNISVREINPLSVSIQMDGLMTYADTSNAQEVKFLDWIEDSNNSIRLRIDNQFSKAGQVEFEQEALGVLDIVALDNAYGVGVNVPFNIASRHGSTFINGATDGTALTANTTPTALPYLQSTDFDLGYDYMGTIGKLRVWSDDIGDTGIAEASA